MCSCGCWVHFCLVKSCLFLVKSEYSLLKSNDWNSSSLVKTPDNTDMFHGCWYHICLLLYSSNQKESTTSRKGSIYTTNLHQSFWIWRCFSYGFYTRSLLISSHDVFTRGYHLRLDRTWGRYSWKCGVCGSTSSRFGTLVPCLVGRWINHVAVEWWTEQLSCCHMSFSFQ